MSATLQEYTDAAPTIMALGEFTVLQVENKLSTIPAPPTPSNPPDVTKAKAIAIFNSVFSYSSVKEGIEQSGGILQIAQDNDLVTSQVVILIKELNALHGVYLESLE